MARPPRTGSASSQQDAQIEIGFRHFWVESDGAFVFGAGFGNAFERGVGVGELEMGVGHVGLFGEKFLEWRDGGFEIIFVDVALGFVEKIV